MAKAPAYDPAQKGQFPSLVRPGGLVSKLVPQALVQSFVNAVTRAVHRRYPDLHGRMKDSGDFSFLIDPVDFPFRFLLRFDEDAPRISVLDAADEATQADAAIRGRVSDLVGVLQGEADGDALFFSRNLVVEGNMEATLALRNAIENAEIDLSAMLGPFGGAARAGTRAVDMLAGRAARDLRAIRSMLLGPVERECEKNRIEIAELNRQLALLRTRINRRDAARPAAEGGPR